MLLGLARFGVEMVGFELAEAGLVEPGSAGVERAETGFAETELAGIG